MLSQKVCETPDEADVDMNSISITKCTIKESKDKKNKKSRQISVKVSANRRYLKKREVLKKQAVSGIGSLGTAGVEKTEQKSEITKSLSLKNNIEDIKNKLSAEEVRKASKFSMVDKIPLFESCKKAKKSEQSDCFNEQMVSHISKHFRYPSEAIRKSIQGEVWVRFIIDKNGEVKNIKTLGPKNGNLLNQEAARVVSKLSQFIPAKKDGGRISVKYGFPIAFALEE
jgi:TonB family protein